MEISCFKTLWGHRGSWQEAALSARQQGFDGIEGPALQGTPLATIRESLDAHNLKYIAEIVTAVNYVPDRRWTLAEHLQDFRRQVLRVQELQPLFITCLGGCDAWSLDDAELFFRKAMDIADQYHLSVSFETHRGRPLFNPWATLALVKRIPELKLTCDFSHWCVVCEGLQGPEEDIILELAANAQHIHGRVGYDQGPQVPDPFQGIYTKELSRHLRWWEWIWRAQQMRGMTHTTLTPEFGPDGYQYRSLDGQTDLVNLDQLNVAVAKEVRVRHKRAMAQQLRAREAHS